jgi:pantetheine-phosphate adenylyltransferase
MKLSTQKRHRRRIGVYAGSFDPLTLGHLWMIEQGALLFDQFVVAIGINPDKKFTFSLEERLEMVRESTSAFSNIVVEAFSHQFLIRYAESMGANYILRGIRSGSDYEYERGMRNINGDLNSNVTTLFLMPPRDIAEISSSMVKGLIGPDGWQKIVKHYVPAPVYGRILKSMHGKSARTGLV